MKLRTISIIFCKILFCIQIGLTTAFAQWGIPHSAFPILNWENLKSEKYVLNAVVQYLNKNTESKAYFIFDGNKKSFMKAHTEAIKYLVIKNKIKKTRVVFVLGYESSQEKYLNYEIWFEPLDNSLTPIRIPNNK